MGALEFVASLVGSLAWPAAVVVAVLILRAPLARALSGPVKRWKAGPSGVEVEYHWQETIDETRAELEQSPEAAQLLAAPPGLDDDLARLVEVSPRAAVMEAFARVERGLRTAVGDDAGKRYVSARQLAQAAKQRGNISEETLKSIEGLVVLRNLAAHDRVADLDAPRAMEFVVLADAVLYALRGFRSPSAHEEGAVTE